MADAVPRARDPRRRHQHSGRAVRPSAPERGRAVRDGADTATDRCGCPVCRRGFRAHRATIAGPPQNWAPTPWTCSTNWDSIRRGRRTGTGLGIGATVDFEMGPEATRLRTELRELVNNACARRLSRRLHRRPGRPRDGPAVLPDARRARPAVPVVAGGVRRGGRVDRGSRPWSARRCGHTTSRAARSTWASTGSARSSCATARRAAAQAPAADRARRGDLVPGLLRAGGRLRPRVAADRPRDRDGDGWLRQRPEDLDVLRHDGAVVLPARPHHQGARRSSRA